VGGTDRIDGVLNGGGIIGYSVAHCAELGLDIQPTRKWTHKLVLHRSVDCDSPGGLHGTNKRYACRKDYEPCSSGETPDLTQVRVNRDGL
jgi:hypothetical protein